MAYLLILMQSFRKFLVGSYGITNPELEFHIHDQNETCNGSGDVAPHVWKGIASVRESLDSVSRVYYVCFAKKERKASVTICHDSSKKSIIIIPSEENTG